jgi:hypothetical protein
MYRNKSPPMFNKLTAIIFAVSSQGFKDANLIRISVMNGLSN